MPGNDGLHNLVAQALANQAIDIVGGTASISNMRNSYPFPKSNMPPTPFTIIGPPRGRQVPASSEEVVSITFPMRVYMAKIRESSQSQHDANEWVDAFLLAFRSGIQLGIAGVIEAVITAWTTDNFFEIGDELYQAVEFTVDVQVFRAATYTP